MTAMAILDFTHSGSGFAARLADGFARFSDARARRGLYRRTVRELDALGDRELADLGLSRGMIRGVAGEATAAAMNRR